MYCTSHSFQPSQRLSSEQMLNLLKWLAKNRPETDRGRFGYAQYLSRYGPAIVRQLPHGILVELVQLLLNQKAILFKKGRITVSPYLNTDGTINIQSTNGNHSALGNSTPASIAQMNNASKLADEFAKLSFNAAIPDNNNISTFHINNSLLPNNAAFIGNDTAWSTPTGKNRTLGYVIMELNSSIIV